MPAARKYNFQDMHETFHLEVTVRGLDKGRMQIFSYVVGVVLRKHPSSNPQSPLSTLSERPGFTFI
jgi:hypothetical protein